MKRLTLQLSSCKTKRFRITRVLVTIAVLLVSANLVAGRRHEANRFDLVEATIDSIHNAFDKGTVTPEELAWMYLVRISTYDPTSTATHLNSYIHVNTDANHDAHELPNGHGKGLSPIAGRSSAFP